MGDLGCLEKRKERPSRSYGQCQSVEANAKHDEAIQIHPVQ